MLTHRIPLNLALEYLFTGEFLDAQEAHRLHLVNKVVPPEELMPTVQSYVEKIQENAPLAMRAIKQAAIRGLSLRLEDRVAIASGLRTRVLQTEDADVAMAEIQAILDRLAKEKEGFDASMRQLVWWPGYVIDEDEPIVRIACRAFETVVGRKPTVAGKDAGTDASWINVLGDIPVIMFSPGNGLEAMNADENVAIDDLITATKVIGQILYDVLVDGAEPGGA